MSSNEDKPLTALELKLEKAMIEIQNTLKPNEDDRDQNTLVQAIQNHRALILEIATSSYAARSHDPKMLEALSSLISQLEKSVRDDRKERSKKEEQQDNKLAFKQVVEALGSLSAGRIQLPTFDSALFTLDPLASQDEDRFKIREGELEMGHISLDFDGNKIN